MTMGESLSTTALPLFPRGRFRRRALALRARVHHHELEDALAAGADPWARSELMVCAAKLSAFSTRRRFAAAIDGLITLAEHRPCVSPMVPIRRDVVLAERHALTDVPERLRVAEPVRVAGVARVAQLLRASSSPLFCGDGEPADGALRALISQCWQAVVVASREAK